LTLPALTGVTPAVDADWPRNVLLSSHTIAS